MNETTSLQREPGNLIARPGKRLRITLLAGFGLLLTLLSLAGVDAIQTLTRSHEMEQTARRTFLARNEAMVQMRSYLGHDGSRLEGTWGHPATPGIGDLGVQMQSSLRDYPANRAPQEDALLQTLLVVVSQQQRMESNGQITCEVMFPQHLQVIAAAEHVAAWDHQQFQNADALLLTEFDGLRRHLTRLLLLMLSSGLLIAVGSIVYIARQDREVRVRYAELVESRNALGQLSSRLLDAQEQERRSISRELHDEVGQSLGALLVDVGRLSALLPPDNFRMQEHVKSMRALAEQTVQAVRNIALLLRPSMLDDLGLVAALEWQGREVSRRGQLEVEVEASGLTEDLGEDYKICIFRLTQEALNNAAKHSGGRHAWVQAGENAEFITLTVRDDGRGFDPARSRGLGLLGMEERVRNLGGTFKITSGAGEGTLVAATLPVR